MKSEWSERLYKKGDYVELNEEVIVYNDIEYIFKGIGVIKEYCAIGQKQRKSTHMYDVDYVNEKFEIVNIDRNYVCEVDIIRKLSQTEVDDLKVYIDSKKYNL